MGENISNSSKKQDDEAIKKHEKEMAEKGKDTVKLEKLADGGIVYANKDVAKILIDRKTHKEAK